MSAGSFDRLYPLDLSEGGNEAEKLIAISPKHSAVEFRGWLETVLEFVDKHHHIDPLPVHEQGKGANAKRIERLPKNKVEISRAVLKAMDDIRLEGNQAAHPKLGTNLKTRFTVSSAEAVRANAWLIRDWLYEQYVEPAQFRKEEILRPITPAAVPSGSFDGVGDVRPEVSKPIAVAFPKPHERYRESPSSFETEKRASAPAGHFLKRVARALAPVLVLVALIGGAFLLAKIYLPASEIASNRTVPKSTPPQASAYNSQIPEDSALSLNDPFNTVLAAANEGDSHAQNIIGIKYHMGWGTPQNELEAAKWFRRGADQGYAASESWLGTMYRNGWGVPKNETEARRLYKLAAEQGNIAAKSALADPLYNTRR